MNNEIPKLGPISKFYTGALVGTGGLVTFLRICDKIFGEKLIWEHQNARNRIRTIIATGLSALIIGSIGEEIMELIKKYEKKKEIEPED